MGRCQQKITCDDGSVRTKVNEWLRNTMCTPLKRHPVGNAHATIAITLTALTQLVEFGPAVCAP
jgi:hypothetical protein